MIAVDERWLFVVILTGDNDDLFIRDFVNEAVLVRETARPVAFEFVL
jgi:hypothetical protein